MDQQVKAQQQKIYGPFKGNKINTTQNTEGGVPPAARPFNSCLCLCLCLFMLNAWIVKFFVLVRSHYAYQGITTAAPVMNEHKDFSRQSARQRLFYTIPYNESMLPWCMELMLFHYTFRLWSWHMVYQKLH